jgi:hypothetical protein
MMNADDDFFDRLCDRATQPVNSDPPAADGETCAGALKCGKHCRSITMLSTGLFICVHLIWLLSAYICDKILSFRLQLTLSLQFGFLDRFNRLTRYLFLLVGFYHQDFH